MTGFADIQHQERALSILRRALQSGRTHHAYLFDGPAGVGKELTALALARRLMCLNPRGLEPCGTCLSCRMSPDAHPDLHRIHRGLHRQHPDRAIRQSKGLFLVVDVVRHFVIDPANVTPSVAARRMFILRDAERMNEGAQNALLKTLEEPPGAASLILISSAAGRLAATIRSRCQRIPFDLLPERFVRERLVAAGAGEEEAAALAALSDGRLGAALEWRRAGLCGALTEISGLVASGALARPEAFGKRFLEIAESLAAPGEDESDAEDGADEDNGDAEAPKPRSASRKLSTDQVREAVKLSLLGLAGILRDALALEAGAPQVRKLPRGLRAVELLAQRGPAGELAARMQAVQEAEVMLDRNVAPQLALERLAVTLE